MSANQQPDYIACYCPTWKHTIKFQTFLINKGASWVSGEQEVYKSIDELNLNYYRPPPYLILLDVRYANIGVVFMHGGNQFVLKDNKVYRTAQSQLDELSEGAVENIKLVRSMRGLIKELVAENLLK